MKRSASTASVHACAGPACSSVRPRRRAGPAAPPVEPAPALPTVLAVALVACGLAISLHEATHAATCVLTGGQLRELSALHASCTSAAAAQARAVSASASLLNLALGGALLLLPARAGGRGASALFLWLWAAMNALNGAGYWLFSGVAGVGDWAQVIAGLRPAWAWRLGMVLLGAAAYGAVVRLALVRLGALLGGPALAPAERVERGRRLGRLAYAASAGLVAFAGLFHPSGFVSAPVLAGLAAVLGGFSPLLWMMEWFGSPRFPKPDAPALALPRHPGWLAAGMTTALLYGVVLGRALRF